MIFNLLRIGFYNNWRTSYSIVDLNSMIDPQVSQSIWECHVIETQELITYLGRDLPVISSGGMGTSSVNVGRDVAKVNMPLKSKQ